MNRGAVKKREKKFSDQSQEDFYYNRDIKSLRPFMQVEIRIDKKDDVEFSGTRCVIMIQR